MLTLKLVAVIRARCQRKLLPLSGLNTHAWDLPSDIIAGSHQLWACLPASSSDNSALEEILVLQVAAKDTECQSADASKQRTSLTSRVFSFSWIRWSIIAVVFCKRCMSVVLRVAKQRGQLLLVHGIRSFVCCPCYGGYQQLCLCSQLTGHTARGL